MKLAYLITRSDEIGGAQKHVLFLAKHFHDNGDEVIVIAGGDGLFLDEIRSNGIKYVSIRTLKKEISIINDLKSIIKIYRLLNKFKPDILSSHSVKAGCIARILSIFINSYTLFTAHGWSHIHASKNLKKIIYLNIERLLSIFSHKTITVCDSDLSFAIRKNLAPMENIICIPNGMPDIFVKKKYTKNFLKNNILNIVSITRLDSPKDPLTLVKSIKILEKFNVNLNIIGEGEYRKEIKKYILENSLNNKVNLLGRLNDVSHVLSESDLFVLSSFSEGLPRSIIEALSASLPAIASNVGGIKELIKTNINGFIIDQQNPKLFAEAIKAYIIKPQLLYIHGKESREIYENKYTLNKMIKNYSDFYNKVTLKN